MTLALTAQRCANGRNQQVWEAGKQYYGIGARSRFGAVIPLGQRDRAVYCVSHYLFYGDPAEGIDAHGYGREEARADLMVEWFLASYQKQTTSRQQEAHLAHIRRACNWHPKNARAASEELIDKLAAAKATPERFARANLKRQNEARRRILSIYDQLLRKSEGEVPSIRAVAKAAGAHRNTVRAALEKAGQANNPKPDIHDQRARVYDLFCEKQKARAERLRDFRRTKREESALMAKAPATKANKPKNNSSKKPAAAEKKAKNQIAVTKPEPQPEPTLGDIINKLRLQITYKSPDELIGYNRNAKLHSPEQIELLAKSIKDFGFVDSVIIDGTNGIIAGHGRTMAAKKLGMELVPTVEISHLNDLEKRALMIVLNKSQEYKSGWDNAMLALELHDLKLADFDLADLGFELPELEALGLQTFPPGDGMSGDGSGVATGSGSLALRFGIPPFSVLNAREGWWQQRKQAWIEKGINSLDGRGGNLLKFSDRANQMGPKQHHTASLKGGLTYGLTTYPYDGANEAPDMSSGTSIFDPVLTELAYRWFSPAEGTILDPFAGGSVRGIVASLLNRSYVGIDLRPEQIAANQAQATQTVIDTPSPTWILGDSRNIERLAKGVRADFLFSCPPYGDLEKYSDDPSDLSNAASYDAFLADYRQIIAASCQMLDDNRFACFVVGDYRDKKGIYRNFVSETIRAFLDAGLGLYNEAILVTAVGSLPIRAAKQFVASRKLGKTHQNVLVFVKGDPIKATTACGEVEFGEVKEEGESDGAA